MRSPAHNAGALLAWFVAAACSDLRHNVVFRKSSRDMYIFILFTATLIFPHILVITSESVNI